MRDQNGYTHIPSATVRTGRVVSGTLEGLNSNEYLLLDACLDAPLLHPPPVRSLLCFNTALFFRAFQGRC